MEKRSNQAKQLSRRRATLLLLLAFCVHNSHAFSSRPYPSVTTLRERPPTRLPMAFELAEQYNEMVTNYPLVTASLTSGSLCGVSDAIAQAREGKLPKSASSIADLFSKFDVKRNRGFMMKGVGGGLIWLFWYKLADQITPRLLPLFLPDAAHAATLDMVGNWGGLSETTIWLIAGTTTLSVLLDQCLASPLVLALWDIPMPLLLSGAHKEKEVDIPQHVESKLYGLLVENAKIWTLANAVIYNLPLEYRVLASAMTDVVWQTILSGHVNSAETEAEASAETV